jgi:gamma-glutamyltranspeptidase/glutathione hydrolase
MAQRNRTSRRDRTEMVPTILRHPDGRCIALGAAGSTRIPGAVVRGIVNMLDLGMSAEQATAAPAANWYDGTLVVNPIMGQTLFDQLTAAGLPAEWMQRRYGVHYGLLHAVTRDADGSLNGGADALWDGAVYRA